MILTEKNIRQVISDCVNDYLYNKQCNVFLNESSVNGVDFDKWKTIFDSYLSDMVGELQDDYLNELGLSITINPNYVFNGWKSRWLAAYESSSRKIAHKVISIGINYQKLYSEMCKRHIDKDRFNIEAQARITVGHEIGHGLVDYVKMIDLCESELKACPNLSVIKKCGYKSEESLVEEFGQYLFPQATSIWDSVLADALEELSSIVGA